MKPMRVRQAAVVAIALMALGGLTACGGDDDTASDDNAKTATSDPGGSGDTADTRPAEEIPDSDTGNADVDKFCDVVRDYASAAENIGATSSQSEIAKLGKKGAELSSQAMKLSAEAVQDPDLAKDISECSEQLSTIAAGG